MKTQTLQNLQSRPIPGLSNPSLPLEWDHGDKVEGYLRPVQLNRYQKSNLRVLARYKGMLSATARSPRASSTKLVAAWSQQRSSKQVRLEAAQATSPKQWVSESASPRTPISPHASAASAQIRNSPTGTATSSIRGELAR